MSDRSGTNELSYREAGVSIDAGNELVAAIKPLAKSTTRSGVMAGLGGFGGFFDVKAAGYDDPVLVAANDGVGTKLKIAIETGIHETVGIDLVAMCVNDLVVQGAEPLFFLDYLATGALDVEVARTIISGIADGCIQADCALIGGETAEMPGMYSGEDYDLAGFCVGAVERGQELTGDAVSEGDVVLGLASNGVHSNGFSLVRKILELTGNGFLDDAPFSSGESFGQVLLTPTRIYVAGCLAAIRSGGVHAFAHITGGGLTENIPRVLPESLGVRIDPTNWQPPAVFGWLANAGGVPAEEMVRTFNCGIGMVAIVSAGHAEAVSGVLAEHGETVYTIGHVVPRARGGEAVIIDGIDSLWTR